MIKFLHKTAVSLIQQKTLGRIGFEGWILQITYGYNQNIYWNTLQMIMTMKVNDWKAGFFFAKDVIKKGNKIQRNEIKLIVFGYGNKNGDV